MRKQSIRPPSLLLALLPFILLLTLLSVNVILYGDNASYGPNQIALIFSTAFTTLIALFLGHSWEYIHNGMIASISKAMPAILILLLIGSLSGTWLVSGIIPTMIYYGLAILHPTYFLVAACVVSAIVSLVTGSSWSTAATVGIALAGIGQTMGIQPGLVAGAIISGAYFGDKMSPLSDTTNLASAIAGTDLVTHIRYMMLTTIPAISLTLGIFFLWGLTLDNPNNIEQINSVRSILSHKFHISPWLFLVPLTTVFLIVKKIPALPALFAGTMLGGIFALLLQPQIIHEISKNSNAMQEKYIVLVQAMFGKIQIQTGVAKIDKLLTSKGMVGMLNTVWLILSAMLFGGVIHTAGILHKLTLTITKSIKSTGSLITSTAGICIGFNLTTSEQYIAIVVPGQMFTETYKEHNLAPENLSRTLEDSATVTSVLIPWNTCGAFQASTLGVATLSYLPFCFFNFLSPLFSIAYAYLQIRIKKLAIGEISTTN
ncbi:MAG: Na+/H+ antiporter NhaC [Spirochaetota bacterium]